MPNTELLVDVLAHIELDPASWDQMIWLQLTDPVSLSPETAEKVAKCSYVGLTAEDVHGCGTAGCLAGWACLLGGATPERDAAIFSDDLQDGRVHSDWIDLSGVRVGLGLLPVSDAALELLGLDSPFCAAGRGRGESLFDGGNDLDDLYRIGAELFGLPEAELRERVAARVAQQAVTA